MKKDKGNDRPTETRGKAPLPWQLQALLVIIAASMILVILKLLELL